MQLIFAQILRIVIKPFYTEEHQRHCHSQRGSGGGNVPDGLRGIQVGIGRHRERSAPCQML